MQKRAALVLAAGKGTRMRSQGPKVMKSLLGSPMLAYVLAALRPIFADDIIIVAGHGADTLKAAFPAEKFIIQLRQLGTGDALKSAMPALSAYEEVLLINGDAPLISADLLRAFMARARGLDFAFASIQLADPGPYGRVARGPRGCAIVEAKDYDPALHGPASGEVNAGLYLFNVKAVAPLLEDLAPSPISGEYYITDLAALAAKAGLASEAIRCGEEERLLGVNSPAELAAIEDLLAARTASALLERGVSLHAPKLLRISPFASIEAGAEIWGPTEIYGSSRIGAGASIASHCLIIDSEIGPEAEIRAFSHLQGASVAARAIAGPYCRLRPGARLLEGAHAGNFVELKNALLGEGAKANHLTYLGDAEIGAGTNIGAGTITCNYDGEKKHRTKIGANAFVGSDVAFVAPVEIGEGAKIGAGSVITRNVPKGALAIARERQKNLDGRG